MPPLQTTRTIRNDARRLRSESSVDGCDATVMSSGQTSKPWTMRDDDDGEVIERSRQVTQATTMSSKYAQIQVNRTPLTVVLTVAKVKSRRCLVFGVR